MPRPSTKRITGLHRDTILRVLVDPVAHAILGTGIVPHAGWMFSGRIAYEVILAMSRPRTVITATIAAARAYRDRRVVAVFLTPGRPRRPWRHTAST